MTDTPRHGAESYPGASSPTTPPSPLACALELIAQALADREAPHAARVGFALGAAAILADVPGAAHVAALLERAASGPASGLGAALAAARKLLERLVAAREAQA